MLDPINRLDFFKTTVAFYAIVPKSNEKKMLQLFFNWNDFSWLKKEKKGEKKI